MPSARGRAFLTSVIDVVAVGAFLAVVAMVIQAFWFGPGGASLTLPALHRTFETLHDEGMRFYSLLGLCLVAWCLRPSPRHSSSGH